MRSERRIDEVIRFASEVEGLATEIVARVKCDNDPKSVMNTKVIAICLLMRSISNFKGGVFLLQQERIVEGRILARCCYENLFMAVGLAEKPGEIIELLEADDRATRKSRGEFLLEIADGPRDDDGQLRSFLITLGRDQAKTKSTPKQVARIGSLYKAYAFFSQLSSDSGHPTLESLVGRYVKKHHNEQTVVTEPMLAVSQDELEETWSYLSESLLGVCVFLGTIIAGSEIEDIIQPILDRHTSFVNPKDRLS
jgi:uncharacterized protein DUF5677